MFEHRSEGLLSRGAFLRRQATHALLGAGLVLGSLAVGALGYRLLENQTWTDSIYSAAMILTGMGPAIAVKTDAGKLFASAYAFFACLVFLGVAALVIAPALHRLLHALHLEEDTGR